MNTRISQVFTFSSAWRLGALLGLAALPLAGCNKPQAGPDSTTKKKTVLASILFQEDQFYRLIEQGMRDAATSHSVQLLLSNSSNSLDKEIAFVENYAAQGVAALMIAPVSATSSVPALKQADAQGIPVLTVDGRLNADFPRIQIRSSQEQLGNLTGQAVREYVTTQLGGKARIGMVEYMSLAPEISGMRVEGFKAALKDLPGVEIVAEQDAWLAPQAADVVDSMLTAHPRLDLIWAANEGGTVGAVTAIRNRGKDAKAVVFGTDMSDQIADFLLNSDGVLQAVTAQKPYEIGQTAVANALKVIAGEPLAERALELPGMLFSRADAEGVRAYQAQLRELAK